MALICSQPMWTCFSVAVSRHIRDRVQNSASPPVPDWQKCFWADKYLDPVSPIVQVGHTTCTWLIYRLDVLNIITTYQSDKVCENVYLPSTIISALHGRIMVWMFGILPIHTEMVMQSMNANVWCWGKPSCSLFEILPVTMGSCKCKILNEF